MPICAVWSGGDRRTGPCIIVRMAKKLGIHTASETRSIEGLLRLLVERLEEAQQSRLGASIYIGDRIAFDREKFDHMDERVYMSDPETYDLVYINEAACRDLYHRCHQHCHARGKSVRRHPENALENQLGARCRPHLHF